MPVTFIVSRFLLLHMLESSGYVHNWDPCIIIAGCQLKTFILMVKPLKSLFFSEKPLKTFILHDKPLFSGKAVFQYFCCMGLCPLKCTLGRNSGIFGILWCFQMAGYMGQLIEK